MNERIKELAIEATKYANTLMIDYLDLSDEDYNKKSNQEYNKKFAELIVAECMDQVRDEVQYITDWDKADRVVNTVKKHFGVEE